MADSSEPQDRTAQPTQCKAGCGFYSNVGTGGLCSKCYREQAVVEGNVKATAAAVLSLKQQGASATVAPSVPTTQQQHQQQAEASVSLPTPSPSAAVAASPEPAEASTTPQPSGSTPPPRAPSTTRCMMCNKKVGLTGFSCKCHPEAVFCSQHRYAEAHACTYDYKAAGRQQLAESNPVIQAQKVQRL